MMIKARHILGGIVFTAAFVITGIIDDPSHYDNVEWYATYQYEDGCKDWYHAEYDAYLFECDGVFYKDIDERDAFLNGK